MSGWKQRQRDVDDELVAWVERFLSEHGYAPTTREVGDAFGWTSSSTVWFRLERLRRAGRVDWVNNQNRTLHVVKSAP